MNLAEVLRKYEIPSDARGTCGIQTLEEKHVSYLDNSRFIRQISANAGAYILVRQELYPKVIDIPGNIYIQVDGVLPAFLEIHNTFHSNVKSFTPGMHKPKLGNDCVVDSSARFGENVVLGERVKIHPYVVIGSNVSVGDDTEIFANTAVYDRVHIGKRNIIDSNASIGGDGYRIMKDQDGNIQRIIHIGGVVFGDDVEFGNSSCVDRGTFGNTFLENRVKVDNMVHIGHNVHVKENSQLAASSCIGGSTIIGRNCWIGIGATLSNGLIIGDNASILINAVVVRDVSDDETVSGFYAMPNDAWRLVVKDHAKRFGTQVMKMKMKKESE